jgi:hypothetical protein
MIRTLAIIAVAGFLVSVVTISVAVGITGPQAIANGAWSWGPFGWNDDHHHGSRFEITTSHTSGDDGPQTTKDLPWTGGDSLDVDIPADVQYTQASGPAKVTVTGSQEAVADVKVENGRIRYSDDNDHDEHLTIAITAPSVSHFRMQSSGELAISGYKQDALDLNLEGDANVRASGEAKTTRLTISGSADADLGGIKTQAATVDIEGSGDATLAPTDAADVTLEGSGDVTLLTHPARLQSHISGSGRVHQKG